MPAFRVLASLLLILFAGFCAGCGHDSSGDGERSIPAHPVAGGALRVAAGTEPDVLNSLITTSAYSARILALINDGLVGMNSRLEWEPALAESWTWSSDGLTLEFKLREGVRWSDGAPFSAHDVVASYALFTDPRVDSSRRSNFAEILGYSAPDSHTVQVRFAARSRDQLFNANLTIFPEHLIREYDLEDVERWEWNRAPVGLGPYRLQRWDAGERIVLERNPHFWGEPAYLDRVIFEFTPDAMVRLLRLEAGEVDMVVGIPLKDESRLRKNAPEIRVYPLSGRLYGYLTYNLRNPMLADARVRRALSHAIDRRAFTENLMFGRAQPAASLIVPALAWAHDPKQEPDPLDLEHAAELLSAAGFVDQDGDGILERDGEPFEIQVTTRTGDPVRENGVLILQENLARAGVRVRIRMMESGAALAEVRQGDFDVYYGHFQSRLSVDPTMLVGTGGSVNYGGYSDARMDEMIRQGLGEMDRERARLIWFEFQEYFAQEQPWSMLYYFDTLVGIREDFRDCSPDNLSPFYELERWWRIPGPDLAPR